MPGLLEIDYECIERLNDLSLTKLLKTLLLLEVRSHKLRTSSVFASLKIDVPDGGEDARVEWQGDPARTNWIPNKFTILQSKAEKKMSPQDFANACFNKAKARSTNKGKKSTPKPDIKPALIECIKNKGSYVFFYGSSFNKNQQKKAITQIKKDLLKAGLSDAANVDIKIYDANSIADWANEHLSAQFLALRLSKRPVPIDLRTWDKWHELEAPQFKFETDDTTDQKLEQFKDHISNPRSVMRIVGLPFMGKSRFVLEAVGQDDNLKKAVIYFDAGDEPSQKMLTALITDSVHNQLGAIFVIDNCPLKLHKALAKIFRQSTSEISLVTLGSDPEENSGEDRLDITESSNIIKKILAQSYGETIIPADMARIIEYAQGFPGMAVLLANARLQNLTNIGELTDDDMLERLLGAIGAENEARAVIQTCALFKNIGFEEHLVDERQYAAAQFTSLSAEEFYGYAQDFIQRRIIQKIGSYVTVVPRPLALRLAADWWKRCSPERAKQLMDVSMPERLLNALADQMSLLDYLPRVQSIVSELCSTQGPFGSAEVLNTEHGSCLFRSLLVVTPLIAANGLRHALKDLTQQDLSEIGPGRRNLVRALEKLIFRQETFLIAGELLLRFAASENEAWHNNATGQFLQLFHLRLPGTTAPLAERINLLDWALNDVRPAYHVLGLKAIGEALEGEHFSRLGGVEVQGSQLVGFDYAPKSDQEVFDYWQQCMNRLVRFLPLEGELGEEARKQLARRIYMLLKFRCFDLVEQALNAVSGYPHFWSEGYKSMQFTVRQLSSVLPESDAQTLLRFLDMLSPKTWVDQVHVWVEEASYNNLSQDEDGKVLDGSKTKAEEFAHECAASWPDWRHSISSLLSGKQNYGYQFAVVLGKELTERESFVEAALQSLRELTSSVNVNPTVLGGFLKGANDDSLTRKTLNELASDETLHKFVIPVTMLTRVTENELKLALNLARQGKIKTSQLSMFAYGSVLSHLPANVLNNFGRELLEVQDGSVVALTVLFMYCFGQPARWPECASEIREVLLNIDPSSLDDHEMSLDLYHWQQSIVKILGIAHAPDFELAIYVTKQIVKCCTDSVSSLIGKIESVFKPLLKILLSEEYREKTWPIIASALLSDDIWLRHRLQMVLGNFVTMHDERQETILGSLPEDFLLDWCKTDEKAALFVARAIPVIEQTEAGWHLTSLAEAIINGFGNDEEVLYALSLNLGAVGGSGSMAPYYEAQVQALKPLLSHRNKTVAHWASKQLMIAQKEAEVAAKRYAEFEHSIFDRE